MVHGIGATASRAHPFHFPHFPSHYARHFTRYGVLFQPWKATNWRNRVNPALAGGGSLVGKYNHFTAGYISLIALRRAYGVSLSFFTHTLIYISNFGRTSPSTFMAGISCLSSSPEVVLMVWLSDLYGAVTRAREIVYVWCKRSPSKMSLLCTF